MQTRPEVVAHRGASAYALEHTFPAYDLALAMGADTLELDVRMTADGRLVVLHDRTLLRTALDPRPVAGVRSGDLPEVNRPLRLEAVLDRYGRSARWLIELKDPHPAMETALLRALAGRGLDVTVQSFDHDSLRRLAPDVPVAALICESTPRDQLPMLLRRVSAFACGAGVLHRSIDALSAGVARSLGLRLRAYTVNDGADMARLLAMGVDGLITDRPDVARAAVGRPVLLAA